jgi:CRP-like cAMP-binding protein
MDGEPFSGLDDEQRRLVIARTTRRRLQKGETLFHEGDVGDCLHVVQSGKVAIRTSTPSGDVVTLAVVGAGATFGELSLIDASSRRSASVVALEPTETRVLQRAEFDELRRRHPSVERLLVELLAAQVRRLSAHVLDALYVPVETRVIRRMVELADLYASGPGPTAAGGPVEVPVRQEDVASMAGTTRPTANRVLKQLEDAGIVSLRRGCTVVHDRSALRTLAG